jgi:hypothetical protein
MLQGIAVAAARFWKLLPYPPRLAVAAPTRPAETLSSRPDLLQQAPDTKVPLPTATKVLVPIVPRATTSSFRSMNRRAQTAGRFDEPTSDSATLQIQDRPEKKRENVQIQPAVKTHFTVQIHYYQKRKRSVLITYKRRR